MQAQQLSLYVPSLSFTFPRIHSLAFERDAPSEERTVGKIAFGNSLLGRVAQLFMWSNLII